MRKYSTRHHPNLLLSSAVAAALAFAATSSDAALLVYEGFDGYNAGQLEGQSVTANSIGISGTLVTNSGAQTYYAANPVGLTFGSLQVSGGRGEYIHEDGGAAFLGFQYSGPTVTGTLYSSALINIQEVVNFGSVAGVRVSASAGAGTASAYFQSFLDGNAGTAPATAFQRGFTAATLENGTVAENPVSTDTTFLLIGRYENVGTPISSSLGLSGTATTYVLTLDQFESFVANGGLTDSALDNALIGLDAVGSVYARISNTYTPAGTETYSFTSGNGLQFSVGNAGAASNQNVQFDELRYGTTLADVTPIPEPSTFALLGACGVFMTLRRKRAGSERRL